MNRLCLPLHHAIWVVVIAGFCSGAAAETIAPETLFQVACSACHSLEVEPDHRIGPPLGALADRKVGSVSRYAYSTALSTSQLTWNLATLSAWIVDAEALIPGNSMNFANPLSAEETQQLALWLLSQP